MPHYLELEFDDDNIAELDRHGVAVEDVEAVFFGTPRFFKNKRGRAGTRLMVGPDRGGRLLAVPIVETAVDGRWKPITAWPATENQKKLWRRAK